MPQVEKLSVFLASPGDVPTERRHVEEIVAELNRTVASDKGVVLQVVRWENDAFPGYGQDAQTLINEQIAEMSKYALFVGIMWNRLGTPTSRATSGTVEEFERAVQASKQNGQPDIWFYFRDSASKLDTEDQLEQRKKVLAFKEEVKANGMPWTYKNPADFRDKLRTQMILWLNTFEKRTVTNQDAEPLSPTEFVDDRVKQAAVILDRARAQNSLTMKLLVKTLDSLFNRSTFREEPSIGLCVTQEWEYRLHAAAQTLQLFREYDQFVEVEAPHLLQLYRELIVNISRYCDHMAAYLFVPSVGLRELRPLVGKDEFIKAIKDKRKSVEGDAKPAICALIDPHLKNAIDQMKKLRDELLTVKEPTKDSILDS